MLKNMVKAGRDRDSVNSLSLHTWAAGDPEGEAGAEDRRGGLGGVPADKADQHEAPFCSPPRLRLPHPLHVGPTHVTEQPAEGQDVPGVRSKGHIPGRLPGTHMREEL